MIKKTWLILQIASMIILITGGFSFIYFGNQYMDEFGEVLYGNYMLVALMIIIGIGLAFIMIIAEVRRRTGKITKESSLLTLGLLCFLVFLAYLSV
jgi:hypothetical protein